MLLHLGLQAQEYVKYDISDGLPSNETHDVLQDQQGYLWICTDRGISRFDGYSFTNFDVSTPGISSNTVFKVFEFDSLLWFTCYDHSIFFYNKKSRRFRTVYKPEEQIPSFWLCATQDDGDIILTSCRGEKVLRFKHDDQWSPFDEGMEEIDLEQDSKHRVFPSKRYKDWLVSINSGRPSYVQRFQKDSVIYFHQNHTGFEVRNGARKQLLCGSTIMEQLGNDLCVLTSKGLHLINGSGHVSHLLRDFTIVGTGIIRDFEGNYWISTLSNGLLKLKTLKPPNAFSFIKNHEKPNSLSSTEKHLFIGTSSGRIVLVDSAMQVISLESKNKDEYFTGPTRFMTTGKNRIVTPDVFELNTKTLEEKLSSPISLAQIVRFQNSIAYYQGGSYVYKNEQDELKTVPIPRIYTWHVFEDTVALLTTLSGLYKVTPSTVASPKLLRIKSGEQPRVSAVLPKRNLLIVGTRGHGIYWIYKGITGKFSSPKANRFIHDLELINDSTLLVAGNEGIDQINIAYLKDRVKFSYELKYSTSNQLSSNFIKEITQWRGKVWFITDAKTDTLNVIHTRAEVPHPRLHLNMKVNATEYGERSQFAHHENNFRFEYLALSFKMPQPLTYRYRLETEQEYGTWQYTTAREVDFFNLSPGAYTFIVSTATSDQGWTENQWINFSISPAFWQRSWVQALVGIVALLMGYALYKQRMQAQKRRLEKANRDREIKWKYREMANLSLRNQMNPHFIFNALQSIQRFIIHKKTNDAVQFLAAFATLMRQSLDHSGLDFVQLEEEVNYLKNYLDIEKVKFPHRFHYHIHCDQELFEEGIKIPPLIVQPFVENAIKHAFLDNSEHNLLEIYVSLGENHCEMVVKDNGIGYYNSREKTHQLEEEHRSKGIALVRERMELLHEKHQIGSLNIVSELGKRGTRIELTIPIE